MSSILDALNKLEEERAARQRIQAGHAAAPLAPDEAADVLLGRTKSKRAVSGTHVPWIPIVSAMFVGVAITALAIGIALRFTGSEERQVALTPTTNDATAITVPAQSETVAPIEEANVVHAPPAPAQEDAVAPQEEDPPPLESPPPSQQPIAEAVAPETTQDTAVPVAQPEPTVSAPVVPEATPAPEAVPTPEVEAAPQIATAAETLPATTPHHDVVSEPVSGTEADPFSISPAAEPQQNNYAAQLAQRADIQTQPPPFSTPATVTPPQPRPESQPVDIETLQRLSANDRARLRLDNLRLNVLREASREHPEAMAIINLKKVYLGETIPGTPVRLIGVTATGIGIEVEETRERFRIPR